MAKIIIDLPDGHFFLDSSIHRYDILSGEKTVEAHLFCAVAPGDVCNIRPRFLDITDE